MISDWNTLFARQPLAARAVELALPGFANPVWLASARPEDLGALPPEAFLTAAELTRASAFKFGQPRENFTLGRLAAKLALVAADGAKGSLTPALSPGEGEGEDIARRLRAFELGNGERGEPVVRAAETLGVSLSHVNGLGVAAAFQGSPRVGVDLELIDTKRAETVRKGVPLSVEEEAWLKQSSLPEATALLLLWTAREAVGKALGCGLACKWETLALWEIEPVGNGVFSGYFHWHPKFSCHSWIGPGAVMTVAFGPTRVVHGRDCH